MLSMVVNYFVNAGCSLSEIEKEQNLLSTLERLEGRGSMEDKAKALKEFEANEKAYKTLDFVTNAALTGVGLGVSYLTYSKIKKNSLDKNQRLRRCDKYLNEDGYLPEEDEAEDICKAIGLDNFFTYGKDKSKKIND